MTLVAAALFAALSVSCASQLGGVSSMRGADVAASDKAPQAMPDYVGKKPGLQKNIARTFPTQPPLIPHAVANFDEISLQENQCLSCHGPDKYKEKNAPKLGDSHFKDREGKQQAASSASRHACVMCHAPQVDAPPLVENTFKSVELPVKK
ncbi:MAG: nitrate reductase cytochrome c-type subunit [Betaproteobacteria bacterium]|nr:nitrate reductase cytochrome c-type subunit [Betaproteobacteria bacterium]